MGMAMGMGTGTGTGMGTGMGMAARFRGCQVALLVLHLGNERGARRAARALSLVLRLKYFCRRGMDSRSMVRSPS